MHGNGRERTGRCRRRIRSFTLIELLLVMGVIGLLLVMAVGGYQNIGRASQVNTSITQLKFSLQLARQWAITQRQKTWVVFPISADQNKVVDVNNSNIIVATNVNFRAYGMYAEDSSGTPELIREWSYLPAGVFFDYGPWSNATTSKNLLKNTSYRSPETAAWFSINLSKQPALAYAPSGALDLQSQDPEIVLSEGIFPPDKTKPMFPKPEEIFVTNTVQVYRYTGLPQINRYGEDE